MGDEHFGPHDWDHGCVLGHRKDHHEGYLAGRMSDDEQFEDTVWNQGLAMRLNGLEGRSCHDSGSAQRTCTWQSRAVGAREGASNAQQSHSATKTASIKTERHCIHEAIDDDEQFEDEVWSAGLALRKQRIRLLPSVITSAPFLAGVAPPQCGALSNRPSSSPDLLLEGDSTGVHHFSVPYSLPSPYHQVRAPPQLELEVCQKRGGYRLPGLAARELCPLAE